MSQSIASPAPPVNIVAIVEDYFEANNPTLTEIETLTVKAEDQPAGQSEPADPAAQENSEATSMQSANPDKQAD